MSGRLSVVMRDVRVSYRVYADRSRSLKGAFAGRQAIRRQIEVRALRGVNLTLREGETLGIIGPNGAGKSTLLAAMTGLLPIESGSVMVRSRPRLLSIGQVLRPALSGRRNILIAGLALGIERAEIKARLDEIADFAGLSEFIDLPMEAYSSGMAARLAFAVATVTVPEILLIDEAMAVGDEVFRSKSSARLEEIRASAGAVVIVSHNLNEVRRSCDRVIWIENGVVRTEGKADDVIGMYVESAIERSALP